LLSIESLVPRDTPVQLRSMDLAFVLPWVLGTAALSAVFGMAGGMVLLLVLTSRLPLADAMVLHGALQLVSNGSRMLISARHVRLDIVKRFGLAAVTAALACAGLVLLWPAFRSAVIDVRVVLIATGVIACAEPLLGSTRLRIPQADTKLGALTSGALVSALHLTAGATGPLLDVFFVDSALDRHANVATKAAVQSIGHTLKIGYFALLATLGLAGTQGAVLELSSGPAFVLLALGTVAGTWLGRQALDKLTDAGFRRGTRVIVCTIGIVSLARGLGFAP